MNTHFHKTNYNTLSLTVRHPYLKKCNPIKGFSLIEVLIAVLILAISMTALLKTTQADIRQIAQLAQKNIAIWVAENTVAELQLNLLKVQPDQIQSYHLKRTLMNVNWEVHLHFQPSQYDHLYQTEIQVLFEKKNLIRLRPIFYHEH